METNPHLHIAINMLFTIPFSHLVSDWCKFMEIKIPREMQMQITDRYPLERHDLAKVPYVFIKKSKTSAVKKYFPTRIAGGLGHGAGRKLLEDVMSNQQYVEIIYGSRLLSTSTSSRLSCINVQNCGRECEKCGSLIEFFVVPYEFCLSDSDFQEGIT